MKRAIVIGCPGSGKSTFARALHMETGLPLIHLDRLHWNADKTEVARALFLERLEAALSGESWIIDGNYSSTMEKRIRACDTVFFLDYDTETCLQGIEQRKGKPRPDLPWVEQTGDAEDEAFLRFIRNYRADTRPAVMALLGKYPEKGIFIFSDRNEAEVYLQNMDLTQSGA